MRSTSLARVVLARRSTRTVALAVLSSFLLLHAGCSGSGGESNGAAEPLRLTLGAYTTPREVYGRVLIPGFVREYAQSVGRPVEVRESYLGSGAQARAIASGFEADVAALSLEPDLDTIREANLITHDFRAGEHHGIVTRSVVVIGVRPGNPKNIQNWADLARDGVEVLTPNVRTSGGAMWNVAAIYGAAIRGHAGVPANDPAAAVDLLARILRNVKTMDRSGRDSMLTFERGVGDAIITYENEILVGRMGGQRYDYVIPPSTIQIENPIAVVDTFADRHRVREAAEAFIAYLYRPESQRAFADHGYRPVLPELTAELTERFPTPPHLFTVADLGGWDRIERDMFAEGAAYDRALQASRRGGGR